MDSRAKKKRFFFVFALIYIGIDTFLMLEPSKMKIMTQILKGVFTDNLLTPKMVKSKKTAQLRFFKYWAPPHPTTSNFEKILKALKYLSTQDE